MSLLRKAPGDLGAPLLLLLPVGRSTVGGDLRASFCRIGMQDSNPVLAWLLSHPSCTLLACTLRTFLQAASLKSSLLLVRSAWPVVLLLLSGKAALPATISWQTFFAT